MKDVQSLFITCLNHGKLTASRWAAGFELLNALKEKFAVIRSALIFEDQTQIINYNGLNFSRELAYLQSLNTNYQLLYVDYLTNAFSVQLLNCFFSS